MSARTAPARVWWCVYRSLVAAGNIWVPPQPPGHSGWLLPDVPDVPDSPGVSGVPSVPDVPETPASPPPRAPRTAERPRG